MVIPGFPMAVSTQRSPDLRCSSRALEHGPSAAALLRRAAAQLALGDRLEAVSVDLDEAEDLEPENAE